MRAAVDGVVNRSPVLFSLVRIVESIFVSFYSSKVIIEWKEYGRA
jgi:hypothetical protein